MRVNNTINISANPTAQANAADKNQKKATNNIFAGNLNQEESPLQKRREQAQKQAMKVVGDTFSMDKSIDSDLEQRKNNMEDLKQKNVELQTEIKSVQDKIDAGDLDEATENEYKATIEEYKKRIDDNKSEIKGESQTIQAIQLERLKSHPMVDASKQADAMNKAATDELVAGIIAEAKEQMEEKMDENKEDGEKLQDKLQEQQDALKESVEKQKENAAVPEDSADITKNLTDVATTQDEVSKQLDEIKDKMKLLEEDLKGVTVDEQR